MFKKGIFIIVLILLLFLVGCKAPGGGSEISAEAIYTEAAKTLSLQMTQQSINTLIAQLTEVAPGGGQTPAAPIATITQTQVAPSVTVTPTQPTSVPPTPMPPTPTSDPRRCNHAAFIRDMTVADGTYFTPNAEFTKIWRLQNIGYCTWDSSYSLVFVDGTRMEGDKRKALPSTVRPGEAIDLPLDLIAPNAKGRYTGYWMLSSGTGEHFGLGDRAKTAFWVEIRVIAPNASYVYDFAVNVCSATWRSSSGSLSCPSEAPSNNGSIILLDKPRLENGRTEDEFTLWAKPQAVRSGWINGVYPSYKVKANDHFIAQIGCLYDNKGCAVTFTLDYMLANGRIKNLGEWFEAYEGGTQIINVDLTSLQGQTIQLILGVIAEDKPEKANAFWLAPSIRRIVPATPTATIVPPTPTKTPTPTATTVTEPLAAVVAARNLIAAHYGADPNLFELVILDHVVWSDTCLGLPPEAGEVCLAVQTPGYRMIFDFKDAQFEAHTNLDGTIIHWVEM